MPILPKHRRRDTGCQRVVTMFTSFNTRAVGTSCPGRGEMSAR